MQDLLTASIETIAISFFLVMGFDFITGLRIMVQSIRPQSNSQIKTEEAIAVTTEALEPPKPLDSWGAPIDNVLESSVLLQKPAEPEQKHLLLPQVESVSTQPQLLATSELALDALLAGVDLNMLQLRPARKIARALGIAQKVNGKDQPLSWLRSQIKNRLQQSQEVSPEAIEAVRELLAS